MLVCEFPFPASHHRDKHSANLNEFSLCCAALSVLNLGATSLHLGHSSNSSNLEEEVFMFFSPFVTMSFFYLHVQYNKLI